VKRLMRAAGSSGVLPRKRRHTTVRLPGLRVAPDLVERDFHPDGPNLTWSADITCISTWEGFLYLAPGLIHHSDNGCQYTAVLFIQRCAAAGIEISMGSVGDCYHNAVCETFHASIKKERIYRRSWPTRAEAKAAVFEYLEGWYNPPAPALHPRLPLPSRLRTPPRRPRHRSRLNHSVATAGNGSSPSETDIDVPTHLAQAATNGGQGNNGTRWPLRQVVQRQTH
jgi:transposase InsO family protein